MKDPLISIPIKREVRGLRFPGSNNFPNLDLPRLFLEEKFPSQPKQRSKREREEKYRNLMGIFHNSPPPRFCLGSP